MVYQLREVGARRFVRYAVNRRVGAEGVLLIAVPHRIAEQRQLTVIEAAVAADQALNLPYLGDLAVQVGVSFSIARSMTASW